MNKSKRTFALTTGISLLVMGIAAGYAYGFVYSNFVVMGHSEETIINIQSAQILFTIGIAGWLIVFFLDLLVSWSVYKIFREISHPLSLMTSIARVIYTLFLGVAIFHLIQVISLMQDKANGANVMSFLASFESIWSLGLIVFGLHLMGLGWLSLKSQSIPGVIGWLLIIAGLSYLGIQMTKALFPDPGMQFQKVEMIMSVPMALGELAFALWLVVKARKRKTFTI